MSSAWSSQEIQSKNNICRQYLKNIFQNKLLHTKNINLFVGQT